MMTFLLGLGTETALRALIVYILVHALYKAALFLIVGAIDHEAGTRNLCELGGLRVLMPRSFAASLLALLAMCGMLPFLGFISKELVYEAAYHAPVLAPVLLGASFLTNTLTVFAALLCGALPFMGEINSKKNQVHEAPCSLWLPPLTLGTLGLLWGVAPASLDSLIVSPAFLAIAKHSTPAKLALWHGFNPVLALSACTLVVGLVLFMLRAKVIPRFSSLLRLAPYGPEAAYRRGMAEFLRYAEKQTMFFQNGSLHRYMAVIIALFILVFGTVVLSFSQLSWPDAGSLTVIDAALLALIIIPALAALGTDSRIASVLELSAVGFGVTLLWIVYGAPDLALTQLLVETLTFVLIMLMIRHLPKYREATAYMETKREKLFDAFIAFIAASAFVVLLLQAQVLQVEPPISSFFAENSLIKAHGRNVVNVILVDFRGLDTLGEITVVGLAALGIIGLLQMKKTSTRGKTSSGRAK
jgi:multicomponent Na+:H+ antiporter subunit A